MKKILKGVISALFGIFAIWFLLSGAADEAVETIGDQEDTRQIEEKANAGAPSDSESFTKYTLIITDDNFEEVEVEVPVPKYISEYVMGSLEKQEIENLLYSIYAYNSLESLDELYELAHPVQIPSEGSSFRDIIRESFSIGEVFAFDIKVNFIGVLDSFNGVIQGDSSAPESTVNISFTGDKNLMVGDTVTTVAIFAGFDNGTPTFIALNMEIQ